VWSSLVSSSPTLVLNEGRGRCYLGQASNSRY
jgi:hypothetical protein